MTRKLGDILRDLRNPGISAQTLNEIVREANEFYDKSTKVHSWTRLADSSPTFDVVHANQIDSVISPINGYSFVNNAATSIPNSTETQLTFNNYSEPTPIIQTTSENGKFKIASNFHLFGCIGVITWAAGTGFRKMLCKVYDADDTLLYSQELHGVPADATVVNQFTFANTIWIQPYKNISYVRFFAWQNSGGALNMNYSRIGWFSFY